MSKWIDTSNAEANWKAVADSCYQVEGVTHVPAVAFLDATVALATMFDLIPGMGLAKSAMMENVNQIRLHFPKDAETTAPRTLQSIILNDPRSVQIMMKDKASVAYQLLWLTRAITLLKQVVAELEADKAASMTSCIRKAYSASLKPYHPMILQNTVHVLASAVQNRDTFLSKLANGDALETAKPAFEYLSFVHNHIAIFIAKYAMK